MSDLEEVVEELLFQNQVSLDQLTVLESIDQTLLDILELQRGDILDKEERRREDENRRRSDTLVNEESNRDNGQSGGGVTFGGVLGADFIGEIFGALLSGAFLARLIGAGSLLLRGGAIIALSGVITDFLSGAIIGTMESLLNMDFSTELENDISSAVRTALLGSLFGVRGILAGFVGSLILSGIERAFGDGTLEWIEDRINQTFSLAGLDIDFDFDSFGGELVTIIMGAVAIWAGRNLTNRLLTGLGIRAAAPAAAAAAPAVAEQVAGQTARRGLLTRLSQQGSRLFNFGRGALGRTIFSSTGIGAIIASIIPDQMGDGTIYGPIQDALNDAEESRMAAENRFNAGQDRLDELYDAIAWRQSELQRRGWDLDTDDILQRLIEQRDQLEALMEARLQTLEDIDLMITNLNARLSSTAGSLPQEYMMGLGIFAPLPQQYIDEYNQSMMTQPRPNPNRSGNLSGSIGYNPPALSLPSTGAAGYSEYITYQIARQAAMDALPSTGGITPPTPSQPNSNGGSNVFISPPVQTTDMYNDMMIAP